MADFNQAIKWVEEGKKVKRKNWSGTTHMYLDMSKEVGDFKFKGDMHGTMELFMNYYSLTALDWEIYEEKAKTLGEKIWFIASRPGDGLFKEEDVKEFIRRLKEDEVYYFRCCHKCGRVWQSLHCPHDGCQGTCPDCDTRALSFMNKECNCEFLMEVDNIDKLAGDELR